jgi:hypothetical protein
VGVGERVEASFRISGVLRLFSIFPTIEATEQALP